MACVYSDLVRAFDGINVVVLGDLMLDRYIAGRVRRISPEAPVPVVEVERTYERPGGAANVAANVRGLGARTSVVGIVGSDFDGDRLREVLVEAGLSVETLVRTDRQPTTVKTRVVAHGQQIVRVDRESAQEIDDQTAAIVIHAFRRFEQVDVVILSDYAKGILSEAVCRAAIEHCRERGVPVIVDPKGRNYRRYAQATAITPNQFEAIQALGGDDPSSLCFEAARHFFIEELAMQASLITQSERGMTLLLPNREPIQFSATARDVSDVTGAGDTAASVFALGVAAGASFEEAAFAANVAAGVVVGKAGAASITPDELVEALQPSRAGRGHRSR